MPIIYLYPSLNDAELMDEGDLTEAIKEDLQLKQGLIVALADELFESMPMPLGRIDAEGHIPKSDNEVKDLGEFFLLFALSVITNVEHTTLE